MENTCYTYFCIKGDFDPAAVSRLLGLEPEECWRAGDLRRDGCSRYDCSCWKFGTCAEYDCLTERQMERTIAPLLQSPPLLRRLKK